jgi:hypothetical protein
VRMPVRLAAASVIAAVSMTGCSGTDRADTADTSTSKSPTATKHDKPKTKPLPSQGQVDRATLKLADLPTGYAPDPDPDEDDTTTSSSNPKCTALLEKTDANEKDPSSLSNAPRKAKSAFQADEFGPFLAHSVGIWESDAGPKKGMDTFRELIATCRSWNQTDKDGSKAKITLLALSFPKLADETIALRMKVDLTGSIKITLTADVVAVRKANGISLFTYARFGPADSKIELESLVRTTVERLDKLV